MCQKRSIGDDDNIAVRGHQREPAPASATESMNARAVSSDGEQPLSFVRIDDRPAFVPGPERSITAAGAPPQHDPMSRHLFDADQTLGASTDLGGRPLLAPHAVGYLRRLGLGHPSPWLAGARTGRATDRRPVRMVGVATSNLFSVSKGGSGVRPRRCGPRPLQPFERSLSAAFRIARSRSGVTGTFGLWTF